MLLACPSRGLSERPAVWLALAPVLGLGLVQMLTVGGPALAWAPRGILPTLAWPGAPLFGAASLLWIAASLYVWKQRCKLGSESSALSISGTRSREDRTV